MGFTPGDGAGVLILTSVNNAIAKQLDIHGVIKAIGGCTESKSIIAPNSLLARLSPWNELSLKRTLNRILSTL